jgi:glutamate synthase (NADPH/NADH) large chain
MAFIYDPDELFELRVNPDTVTWQRLQSEYWEGVLRATVEEHAQETNSRYAAMLLHDWEQERGKFWQVVPKEFAKYLPVQLVDAQRRTA